MTASQLPSVIPPPSVVFVAWNTRQQILAALRALASNGAPGSPVVVIDNASNDGTAEAVAAAFPGVRVIVNPTNLGYGAAINQGVAATNTPYVLVANADVECSPTTVAQLTEFLDQHPRVAVVGPRLVSPEGRLQLSWGRQPSLWHEFVQRWWWRLLEAYAQPWFARAAARLQRVDWVLGACFLVRREAFQAVQGMDDRYFLYFEEVDLCTRLRQAGWEIWYLPSAQAVHHGRASMGLVPEAMALQYRRSQLAYYRRYHGPAAAGLLQGYLWVKGLARRWRVVWLAALLAGLFAGIVMAPVMAEPSKTLCAYDHPGDAMISIWCTWVRLGAQAGRWSLDHVPLVEHPDGHSFWQSPLEPAIEQPQLILARFVGEVAAYNLQLWLTFPLAAATMALLLWELTRLPAAAVVGGVLYACAPYHFAHTMQLSLASIQWLPLGLWSWLRLAAQPGLRWATVHALCVGLIVWTTAYYGLLFAVASAVLLAALWWSPGIRPRYKALLGWAALSLVVTAAVSLKWYRPFLRVAAAQFTERYAWPLKHLFVYAAKPWDYLVPSLHHPWLGSWVTPFVRSHLYGSNVVEQTLYLGYVALGLAIVAVARSRAMAPAVRWGITWLALLGMAALWCSAPPFVPLGPFQITDDTIITRRALYFPSALFHQVLPFFRVYARFGLLVTLAVAALAGIGWARLRRKTAMVLVGALLIAEYSIAMPFQSLESVPPAYRWLADYPHDVVIAEYPMVPSTHSTHAEYLFYQRIHGKRMVNGVFEQSPAGRDRSALRDVTAPGVPEALSALGADLVIVHRDRYLVPTDRPAAITVLGQTYRLPLRRRPEEGPPPPHEIAGLEPVAAFDETVVYRVAGR